MAWDGISQCGNDNILFIWQSFNLKKCCNLINKVSKTITSLSPVLVTSTATTTSSFSIDTFTSSTSKYMTGLTVLAKNGTCVTGFTFTFSDSSTTTVGTAYDSSSSISFSNSNQWTPQQISSVASFTGLIVDRIEICMAPSTCATGGNSAYTLGSSNSVGTSTVITKFYGTFGYWSTNSITCLTSFNVEYY